MLPLFKYYVPRVAELEYIVDDDESKHGHRYSNLGLEIKPSHDMTGRDVIVTAYSTKMAVRKITSRLFFENARNVVVPFFFL